MRPMVLFVMGFGLAMVILFMILQSQEIAPPPDAAPATGSAPPAATAPPPPAPPRPPTSIPVLDLDAPVTAPSLTAEADGELDADLAATTVAEPDPIVFPDLVPLSGSWSFENLPGVVDCGAVQVPLAGVTDSGRLEVRDGGGEIYLEGFGEGASGISLTRSLASPTQAVYSGTVDPLVLGDDVASGDGTFVIDLAVVFDSTTRMTATLTGSVESEGFSCAVQRVTNGALTGGEGSTVLDVVEDDPPGVANCDPGDTTPTRRVDVDGAPVAPTPHTALTAFLDAADPPPPATTGFTEFAAPGGTSQDESTQEDGSTHFVAFEGATPFVSIRVDPVDGGFAVTSWESSAC